MRVLVTNKSTLPDWYNFLDSLQETDGTEIPDAQVPFSELAMHCHIAGKPPTRVVLARAFRNDMLQTIWARAEFADAPPVDGLPSELLTPSTIRAIETTASVQASS